MPLSVLCILYISALISCIVSIMGRCPLYVPVLLIAVGLLVGCLGVH
jgi:hypothetical protein